MRYVIEIHPTGCYSGGNPTRADDGEPGETIVVSGDLHDAVEQVGTLRSAEIADQWGDMVARVEYRGGRQRVYDADGDELYFGEYWPV